MSTFEGQTEEYPYISLDRFDGENIKSFAYFLSHNHRDHTVGLFTDAFIYRLQSEKRIKLYCSVVTKELLLVDVLLQKYLKKCPNLSKSIVGLPVEDPTDVPVIDPDTGQEKEKITVTLLPAGHCPGSVMFLIEGSQGNILYTGDFRLAQDAIKDFYHLRTSNGVKAIKSLYIDTTFCVPEMKTIPSRKESTLYVIDVCEKWITKGPEYMIYICHKAALGYEQLYRDVALHFNTKIHVTSEKYAEYKKVGDMQTFTTSDPSETQIHACRAKCKNVGNKHHSLPCGYPGTGDVELEVCTVRVSTMHFVRKEIPNTKFERINDHFYRVLYSFHSSYSEIRNMVSFLKPERVFPNVIPVGCTHHEIQERLDAFLMLANSFKKKSPSQENRALGPLKVKANKRKMKPLSQQSDHDMELDFAQCTPEKKKKSKLGQEKEKQEHKKWSERTEMKHEFPLLFGSPSASEDEAIEGNDIEEETAEDLCIDEESNSNPSQSLFSDINDEVDVLLPDDKKVVLFSTPQKVDFDSESDFGDDDDDDGELTDNEIKTESTQSTIVASPLSQASYTLGSTTNMANTPNKSSKVSNKSTQIISNDQTEVRPCSPTLDKQLIVKRPNRKHGNNSSCKIENSFISSGGDINSEDSMKENVETSGEVESTSYSKTEIKTISPKIDNLEKCDIKDGEDSIKENIKNVETTGEAESTSYSKTEIKTISPKIDNLEKCDIKDGEDSIKENIKNVETTGEAECTSCSQIESKRLSSKIDNLEKCDVKDGENIKGRKSNSKMNLEESVEIVDVIEGHSLDAVEMEQVFCRSSRERYISERLDDYQRATKQKKVCDTPEEIQRPSVVRYPTSGFYSSATLDKTHAAQGYHNMISNIDKILKSPTKSNDSTSVKEELDDSDIVVLNKSVDIVGEVSPQLSASRMIRKWRRKAASCTQARPDSVSVDDDSFDLTDSHDTVALKKRKLNFDLEKPEASNQISLKIKEPQKDEVEVNSKDDEGSVSSVCIDLTNEDDGGNGKDDVNNEGEVNEVDFLSHVSNCSSKDSWTTDIVSSAVESDGDIQHDPSKSVKKGKHKKLWKQKPCNGGYDSDLTDSDAEDYTSENWFMDLHKVKKDFPVIRKSISSNVPNSGGKVSPDEVIILDDSSNGSHQDRATQTPLINLCTDEAVGKSSKLQTVTQSKTVSKLESKQEESVSKLSLDTIENNTTGSKLNLESVEQSEQNESVSRVIQDGQGESLSKLIPETVNCNDCLATSMCDRATKSTTNTKKDICDPVNLVTHLDNPGARKADVKEDRPIVSEQGDFEQYTSGGNKELCNKSDIKTCNNLKSVKTGECIRDLCQSSNSSPKSVMFDSSNEQNITENIKMTVPAEDANSEYTHSCNQRKSSPSKVEDFQNNKDIMQDKISADNNNGNRQTSSVSPVLQK